MTSFGFGSNPLASSGFGAANKTFSFGGNTSTGTSAFGSGTAAPAFGTAATAAPAFGSGATTGSTGFTGFGMGSNTGGGLTFGAPQPTSSSSGGFSFGGGTTAPAGGGFSFASTKPTTTSTGFSFGGTPNTGFGAGTGFGTNTGTGFGTSTGTGFGASTGTGFGTSTGTGFGTSTGTGFGASTGTGFGTSTSTGFGTGTAFGGTNFSSGFGTNTGTAFGTGTNTGFGTGTNTGFGTGTSTGFGTGSSTGFGTGLNTGFGTGFGSGGGLFSGIKTTQPALTFGLGSNTNNNIFKGFGQPLQQQGGAPCPSVALYLAVCAPAYFNDERDEVLKKWNQLQAVWGTGKGFYAPGLPPVEFSPDNEFCRFKAVGYIAMPTFNAEDGLVELVIGKKEAVVREQQTGLVSELCRVYGGAVQVCVEYVNPGPGDNKTRLCYYVQHRSANGETKKANTWDVYNHLKSDQHRQILANLCIEQATPLVSLSESQLKEYLDKPPRGLDALLWEQGKRDNPDPVKYLPVPLVGFQELQTRFRAEETESQLLQGQLDQVAEDVCAVQARQAALTDQLAECHRRQRQMSHRLLQLLVRQECSRKRGVPIGAAEEQLRIRLEALQSQLHAPTQYMGKLNELLSQVSAQGSNSGSSGSAERSALLGDTESDVKEFLAWQQDGISEVVAVLKTDARALQAMLQIRGK